MVQFCQVSGFSITNKTCPFCDKATELLILCYRFIYTDKVQLNADNVLQVMYAAKKYIVTNLSKKCAEFLQDNLSADTAPQLLEQSILFDEKFKILKRKYSLR